MNDQIKAETADIGRAMSLGYCYACPTPIEVGDMWRRERVGNTVPHVHRLVHHPECPPAKAETSAVELGLWWGYLCPAMADIGVLKRAQSDLIALGVDWTEAGRILSEVQSHYVNAASKAAQRYLADVVNPPGVTDGGVDG